MSRLRLTRRKQMKAQIDPVNRFGYRLIVP